jgi:hypothetical protein
MDNEDDVLGALGYHRQVVALTAGALWRVTSPDGGVTTGRAGTAPSARREAAFAVYALSALTRVHARR